MSTKYIPMEHDTLGEYARQLYYLEDDNAFVNEYGSYVFNIYDYITPSELMLFKRNKQYMIVDKKGIWIELIYPDFNYDF